MEIRAIGHMVPILLRRLHHTKNLKCLAHFMCVLFVSFFHWNHWAFVYLVFFCNSFVRKCNKKGMRKQKILYKVCLFFFPASLNIKTILLISTYSKKKGLKSRQVILFPFHRYELRKWMQSRSFLLASTNLMMKLFHYPTVRFLWTFSCFFAFSSFPPLVFGFLRHLFPFILHTSLHVFKIVLITFPAVNNYSPKFRIWIQATAFRIYSYYNFCLVAGRYWWCYHYFL